MIKFTKLQPRFAYAGQFKLENLLPGLNGQSIGSNLNSIDLSGVTTLTLPTVTSFTATTLTASAVATASTGSFANLNVTTAEVTGATGTTATIGLTGGAAGGPATAAQDGWMKVKIAGTQVYVPVWK